MKSSEIVVRVSRGPITESIHHGHIAVVHTQGNRLYQLGNPKFLTYARSSAKLIQALPVIESGSAKHYALSSSEIALLCASHGGEEEHVSIAGSILAKLGLGAEHLQCGVHEPFHLPTTLRMRAQRIAPTSLHNNCSGKHSGMLTLATHMNASHEHYMQIDHPVQQLMLQVISEMSGLPASAIEIGVDGCGVPVFGMGIDRLALAFARLGSPDGLPEARVSACKQIIAAIRQHPFNLAGSDRFDTRLIESTQGRVIGKMGAEGVFALTVPESGIGMVVKIEDGNERALYPAVVEALKQLDLLNPSELEALSSFHSPTLRNWQGTEVGRIRPDFQLSSTHESI
jgi:L-asparaginase II